MVVSIVTMSPDGSPDMSSAWHSAGPADAVTLDAATLARPGEPLPSPSAGDEPPQAGGSRFIGASAAACQLRGRIARLARTNATTLIHGETGTGKEVVALLLHQSGPRSQGPLISVNCAAIPDDMIEGELFGYEKGAFTGAARAYPGKFALADSGTLFLDEVGELPLPAQAKILRAIESREVFPLGAHRARRFDSRIIAATHRDLAGEVAAGRFRADLFYRLAVVRIDVPPLSQRRCDIAAIALHLLGRLAEDLACTTPRLSACALAELERRDWPGNVRELRNALEHAMVFARDPLRLEAVDLPPVDPGHRLCATGAPVSSGHEAGHLLAAIRQAQGNKAQAARLLNLSRMTLYRRLRRLGLDPETL